MKRVVCFGGGDPAIKSCIQSSNGVEKTAIIAGDYYPEDYPEEDPKRVWGPHYKSFENMIKNMDRMCNVVTRETPPEQAVEWVRRSEKLSIEGGFPDRYLNWMINKKVFDLIREIFLQEEQLDEIWSLSAGSISLCKEVRYFIEDDGDPYPKLDISPEDREHLTELERGEKALVLERRTGLGIIPKTVISVHSTKRKERWLAAAGFFYGSRDAFVFLGDDGAMEIFYERTNGVYRPVDVKFDGYHRIRFGGMEIDKNVYLELLKSAKK